MVQDNAVTALEVGTIRQIRKRLVANGYALSENALRCWVREGKVPAVYSGTTAYIAYHAVVSLFSHNVA